MLKATPAKDFGAEFLDLRRWSAMLEMDEPTEVNLNDGGSDD